LNFGCRTLADFKGAGILVLHSLFLAGDSDVSYPHEQVVPQERKIRTVHKRGEECGTPI
jgi:hypothetical protein